VLRQGSQIELTPREFDLLYALASYSGRVFTREDLLQRVWGPNFAGIDRVVDMHVGTLRRKLEEHPSEPPLVQTVRGVGYKFVGGQGHGASFTFTLPLAAANAAPLAARLEPVEAV